MSIVAPGPTPVDSAYPRIDTELSAAQASFPPGEDFANFIATIEDETTTTLPSGQPLAGEVEVATANVPGATRARLLTVLGPGPRHEQDLIVLDRAGVIALRVAWYPANEPLRPTAVIDSFRLGNA